MRDDVWTHGPEYRWFAWRPCWTRDRGWRWLRFVKKRRVFYMGSEAAASGFEHAVEEFC